MADQDFIFSVQISDEPSYEAMLDELGASVLEHLGFPPAAVKDLEAAVRGALDRGAAEGRRRCDIQFRVESGQLLVIVCYEGGAEWRTSRQLPVR